MELAEGLAVSKHALSHRPRPRHRRCQDRGCARYIPDPAGKLATIALHVALVGQHVAPGKIVDDADFVAAVEGQRLSHVLAIVRTSNRAQAFAPKRIAQPFVFDRPCLIS